MRPRNLETPQVFFFRNLDEDRDDLSPEELYRLFFAKKKADSSSHQSFGQGRRARPTPQQFDRSKMPPLDLDKEKAKQTALKYFGLQEGCSRSEIDKAYRKLAMVFHPDKNKHPDAKEKFQELINHYHALIDT